MASTVNIAFAEFLKDRVNLDTTETNTARNSRDWLVGQIRGFGAKDMFPVLYIKKDNLLGQYCRDELAGGGLSDGREASHG